MGNDINIPLATSAANHGDMDAMKLLFNYYVEEKKDYAEALPWLRKLVDIGDPKAQCILGGWMLIGLGGVQKDAVAAAELLVKAGEAGETNAYTVLGNMHRYGADGLVPIDVRRALNYYFMSQDDEALMEIADCYAEGLAPEKSDKIAADYYLRSAAMGNGVAAFKLAQLAEQGRAPHMPNMIVGFMYRVAALKGIEGAQQKLIELGIEKERKNIPQNQLPELAEKGDADAQFMLYEELNGQGDTEQAIVWLKASAEKECPEALCELASKHLKGVSVHRRQGPLGLFGTKEVALVEYDPDKAIALLKQAAEKGYAHAWTLLGNAYRTGGDGAFLPDLEKAVECYTKSQDTDALQELGDCYYQGLGAPKDYKMAIDCYMKSAAGMNARALFSAGLCLEEMVKTESGRRGARSLYGAAMKMGYAPAAARLEEMDAEDKEKAEEIADADTPIDVESLVAQKRTYIKEGRKDKVLEINRVLAQHGDAAAQSELGFMYLDGNGVKQDIKLGLEWLEKAAEGGTTIDMLALGDVYEALADKGLMPQEEAVGKAIEWFSKAAAQDDKAAFSKLGEMYALGLGVEKDEKQAMQLFTKAGSFCGAKGFYNWGQRLLMGNGVEKDADKAYTILSKALKLGNKDAAYDIAVIDAEKRAPKGNVNWSEFCRLMKIYGLRDQSVGLRLPELMYFPDGLYFLSLCAAGKLYTKPKTSEVLNYLHKIFEVPSTFDMNVAGNLIDQAQKGVHTLESLAREAAKYGGTYVSYVVATCYEQGIIVPQDFGKAKYWFLKAAVPLCKRATADFPRVFLDKTADDFFLAPDEETLRLLEIAK